MCAFMFFKPPIDSLSIFCVFFHVGNDAWNKLIEWLIEKSTLRVKKAADAANDDECCW